MEVCAFNPNTWEAGQMELYKFEASLIYRENPKIVLAI